MSIVLLIAYFLSSGPSIWALSMGQNYHLTLACSLMHGCCNHCGSHCTCCLSMASLMRRHPELERSYTAKALQELPMTRLVCCNTNDPAMNPKFSPVQAPHLFSPIQRLGLEFANDYPPSKADKASKFNPEPPSPIPD